MSDDWKPQSDRTECRYCHSEFGSPEDRLDHEIGCGFDVAGVM